MYNTAIQIVEVTLKPITTDKTRSSTIIKAKILSPETKKIAKITIEIDEEIKEGQAETYIRNLLR